MAMTRGARRHFEAVAEAMAAEKHDQRLEALRSSAASRVRAGFEVGSISLPPGGELALDERAEGQVGLARRALLLRR
jgi:hypothetical protein